MSTTTLQHDPLFNALVAEVDGSIDLYKPSQFWDHLNSVNASWLTEFGMANFKRTVSQNYYNWLIISHRDPQFRAVLREWLRRPSLRPLLSKMDPPDLVRTTNGLEQQFGRRAQLLYRLFVTLLWDVTARHDRAGLTSKLEEPSLGNPLGIWSDGRRISQDLANSIREYNTVAQWDPALGGTPATGAKKSTVAELGAGYGRLAHVFLSNPRVRYLVFDIPPALYVSHWYLSRLAANRKVFSFRPFRSFAEIESELAEADIAFFTPNQLSLFPERYVDVFISISTLPEMTPRQVDNYLALISRVTNRTVYLKQWRKWFNERDNFDFSCERLVLPDDRWRLRLDAPDLIQSYFQERLWTSAVAPAAP